jgi:hypothetical protein
MPQLSARVIPRASVSDADAAAMYVLFERYYDSVSEAQFLADLSGKSHVIELREDGALRGFSTIALIDFTCGNMARRAIFSGDTIIDHRYWGEQVLPLVFCEFAGALHASAPDTPLYWFLISKGHRTYRYLKLFAREYYPCADAGTSPEMQACMDVLANARFGEHYDAARGVLRFPSSRGHLKPQWADVRESQRARAEVRFFLQRNPGYASGDELVCLTRLIPGNLRSYARRAFEWGMKRSAEGGESTILPGHGGQRGALSRAVAARADGSAAATDEPAAA